MKKKTKHILIGTYTKQKQQKVGEICLFINKVVKCGVNVL